MHTLPLLWLLAAAPFWETKPPEQWSLEQVYLMLRDSPWAQIAEAVSTARLPTGVQVYLATATPIEEAELELSRRTKRKLPDDPALEEYRAFIRENRGSKIVLAVACPDLDAMTDAAETKKMEEQSLMKIGRRKYKSEGHFPPTPSDPFLRLVFPRVIEARDSNIDFDLYLPAATPPFRQTTFRIKDLVYHSKPDM